MLLLQKQPLPNCCLPVLSGTNLDDLNDFRPGLKAAQAFNVYHPYVVAGINKAGIRNIARNLDLNELSELPAAPCLSSRVETGIRIDEQDLNLIDQVEEFLRHHLGNIDLRCRKRVNGVCIEIDENELKLISKSVLSTMIRHLEKEFLPQGTSVFVESYIRGSAFTGKEHHD